MKLLRNDPDRRGICKYALIRLDKLDENEIDFLARLAPENRHQALADILTEKFDLIEFGLPNEEDEFFAIKLKDQRAERPLRFYADEAAKDGDEAMCLDVVDLAARAGINSPWCQKPD